MTKFDLYRVQVRKQNLLYKVGHRPIVKYRDRCLRELQVQQYQLPRHSQLV